MIILGGKKNIPSGTLPFGRMPTGPFLVQKCWFCSFIQCEWIGSSRRLEITKKKSICGFSTLCVGQQNLEGGNSRLILFSLDSIQQQEEGRWCRKCQLASQIRQNIWRLHGRPKPKNELDPKGIVQYLDSTRLHEVRTCL